MSEDIQKTALRLPRELHTAIHKAAKESGRTMNAEIVYRLEKSFPPEAIATNPITEDEIRNEYLDVMVYERCLKDLKSSPLPENLSTEELQLAEQNKQSQYREMEKLLRDKKSLLADLIKRLRDQ